MGLLQYIAIPIRRLLHDDAFSSSLVNAHKTIDDLWHVYSEHAKASMIWSIIVFIIAAIFLIGLLIAISFIIIPNKRLIEWQKGQSSNAYTGRKKFKFFWLILVFISLCFSMEAVWSNTRSMALYSTGEAAQNVVDSVERQNEKLREGAAQINRYLNGFTAMALASIQDNVPDMRPILKRVDSYAIATDRLIKYSNDQAEELKGLLLTGARPQDIQEIQDALKALPSVDEIARLKGLLSLLQNTQGSGGRGVDSGVVNLDKLIPSLKGFKEEISKVSGILQQEELSRGISVYLVIFLFIGFTFAGFHFSRLRKFKLVSVCFLLLLFITTVMLSLQGYHIVLGTTLGAFCDNATGTGRQIPIFIYSKRDVNITLENLRSFAMGCKERGDLISALYQTFASSNKPVNVTKYVTVDKSNSVVTLAEDGKFIKIPMKNGQADYRDAAEKALDEVISFNKQTLITKAKDAKVSLEKAAKDLDALKLDDIEISLLKAKSRLSDLPLRFKALEEGVSGRITELERLLKEFATQSSEMGKTVKYLANFLGTFLNNPADMITRIKGIVIKSLDTFINDTFQPTMNCQQVGNNVTHLFDRVCGAAEALQGLILGLILIANFSFAALTMMFISQRYPV